MNNDAKSKRLGENPLSSLTAEDDESAKILRNNLISYKARKKCVHLNYSKSDRQHHCDSPRSRQRGFLGKEWQEKCRKCHVKVTLQAEPEPPKKINSGIMCKILSIK